MYGVVAAVRETNDRIPYGVNVKHQNARHSSAGAAMLASSVGDFFRLVFATSFVVEAPCAANWLPRLKQASAAPCYLNRASSKVYFNEPTSHNIVELLFWRMWYKLSNRALATNGGAADNRNVMMAAMSVAKIRAFLSIAVHNAHSRGFFQARRWPAEPLCPRLR